MSTSTSPCPSSPTHCAQRYAVASPATRPPPPTPCNDASSKPAGASSTATITSSSSLTGAPTHPSSAPPTSPNTHPSPGGATDPSASTSPRVELAAWKSALMLAGCCQSPLSCSVSGLSWPLSPLSCSLSTVFWSLSGASLSGASLASGASAASPGSAGSVVSLASGAPAASPGSGASATSPSCPVTCVLAVACRTAACCPVPVGCACVVPVAAVRNPPLRAIANPATATSSTAAPTTTTSDLRVASNHVPIPPAFMIGSTPAGPPAGRCLRCRHAPPGTHPQLGTQGLVATSHRGGLDPPLEWGHRTVRGLLLLLRGTARRGGGGEETSTGQAADPRDQRSLWKYLCGRANMAA